MGENFKRNFVLVDRVKAIAARKGCTPAQLALAWLLGRGEDIAPIPGTRSVARLEENVAAAEITLTAEETAELDHVMPPTGVAGQRYPEDAMRMVNL